MEQEETYALVVLPEFTSFPITSDELPEKVRGPSRKFGSRAVANCHMQVKQAITAIVASDSASKVEDLAAWVADKDLEVSKHADNLLQLNTGRKVPSSNWKCEHEGCDKTENLWLNLTDGLILCGRRNWDGSGGNGHALDHFDQTGFPLSVKLGTITAQGAGTAHRPNHAKTITTS